MTADTSPIPACDAARQRYRDARLQLNVYSVFLALLTLVFLAFVVWVVVEVIRGKPVTEQVVQLVGLLASGAIGSFILARRKDAKAEADQAFADVVKYCGSASAQQLHAEMKFKLSK